MANKDLFEQAIADAKKLKEISLANAKEVIEEAFAPKLQEMFRLKLSELDNLEEIDYTDEDTVPVEEDESMMNDSVDETTLEEILAELELEEGEESEKESVHEAAKADDDSKEEADDDDSEKGSETVGEVDLDTLVDALTAAVMKAMGSESEEPAEDTEEEAGEEEDLEGGNKKDDVYSLDEILAELAEGDTMTDEGIGSALKAGARKVGSAMTSFATGASMKDIEACKKEGRGGDDKIEACVNEKRVERGEKPLSLVTARGAGSLAPKDSDTFEEGIGSALKAGASKVGSAMTGLATGASIKDVEACKKMGKGKDEALIDCVNGLRKERGEKPLSLVTARGAADLGGKTAYGMEEGTELNEAIRVIEDLKAQLNEVNLLNAKLLYVNKIFKAKSLNENQKLKVVNAFDRATTIKETKNIYETLKDSFSIAPAPKKAAIKESLGFASKPVGKAPATPIVEADAYVYRMQQLAGIKKPNI